jgi:hypothetical protein
MTAKKTSTKKTAKKATRKPGGKRTSKVQRGTSGTGPRIAGTGPRVTKPKENS